MARLVVSELDQKQEEWILTALASLSDEMEVIVEKEGWILLDPIRGILMVATLAGEIQYHPKLQLWYRMDARGKKESITSPFETLAKQRASLLQKINQLPWLQENRLTTMKEAVCFPTVQAKGFPLPLGLSPDCLMDAEDIENVEQLQQKIDQIYARAEDSAAAWKESHKTPLAFQPHFKSLVQDEGARIFQLTEDQCRVLTYLEEEKRVGVVGSAGTGKTLLAYEKARLLAESGKRTLLTCYNVPLEAHLKSLGDVENLTILRFHALCMEGAKEVGNYVEEHGPEHQDRVYWNHILPFALTKAIEQGLELYDAVIIDEAQDIAEQYAGPLFACLKDPEQGILHAFYDEKQTLYQPTSTLITALPRYDLSANLRNSQQIHELSLKFGGDLLSFPLGAVGRKPELLVVENEEYLEDELAQILEQLIEEEKIAPEKIAILTGKRPDRLQMALYDEIGVYPVTRADQPSQGKVILDSIYRFKGLDSPIVILTALGGFPMERISQLLYVGITRAQSHLIFKEREEFFQQSGLRKIVDVMGSYS